MINRHQIALLIKKLIFGKHENYRFYNQNLRFLTGTRPIKRKYQNANSDVVRNDVLQINFFEENFKPGDVLWDIGSHHGHYSIFAAAIAANVNQVFSFEPDMAANQMQVKNIAANGFQERIKLFNIAVAGEDGMLMFDSQNGNSNSHIVKDQATPATNTVKVTAKTIDTLLNELPRPGFVKIDTEGAEIDILQKADGLLADKNVQFICELHPFAWDAFDVKYETFTNLLKTHGRVLTLLDTSKRIADLPFYGTVLF